MLYTTTNQVNLATGGGPVLEMVAVVDFDFAIELPGGSAVISNVVPMILCTNISTVALRSGNPI